METLLQIIIGISIIFGVIIYVLLIKIHKALTWNIQMISGMNDFLRQKFDYELLIRLQDIENILDDIKEHKTSEDQDMASM